MKCFYHKSDLDGQCSGAIVKYHYPECEMIGVEYNDTVDFDSIVTGEVIFVVDFSFDKETMERLAKLTTLIYIDHHKSSIEENKDISWVLGKRQASGLSGDKSQDKAACELTWETFGYSEIPCGIKLLSQYDVWNLKNPDVLHFQYGMRQFDTRPEKDLFNWEYVFKNSNNIVESIIDSGQTILAYEKMQNEKYATGMAYETKFEGYNAIVMNKSFANSSAFDSVWNDEKHDIMILFGSKKDEYKYSIYTKKNDIDCSMIAKKYGGGGHPMASGFYSKERLV